MVDAPRPTNFKQLESFIGLITYYARFLPDRAEKLKSLYDCAKQNCFEWTLQCNQAFKWVKNELISPRVLTHYDPEEKIVLACDASEYGLSAILSHCYKDGSERAIRLHLKYNYTRKRKAPITNR